MPAGVGVRQVCTDLELIRGPVRSLDAHCRPVVAVVVADEEAVVVERLARQVERGPIVPPRHGDGVLDDVSGRIQLAGVIVYRCAGRNRRAPAASADTGAWAIARATERRVGMHAATALPVPGLDAPGAVYLGLRGR